MIGRIDSQKRRTILPVGFALLVSALPLKAATVFVSPTGDNTNDGLSWAAAKATVQAGIDAAASGDEVWVASGTYIENVVLNRDVALYGGFSGIEDPATFDLRFRNFTANDTTLNGGNSDSVVSIGAGTTSAARVDGFTIRNGYGNFYGGGIYIADSHAVVANNVITGNAAVQGGGIYCSDAYASIMGNIISGNQTDFVESFGGGIYCWGGGTKILDNVIEENDCFSYYAGPNSAGGGIYCVGSAVIADNIIRGNTLSTSSPFPGAGSVSGGGIYAKSGATIIGNIVAGNTGSSPGADGGGIHAQGCTVESCIVVGNVLSSPLAGRTHGGGSIVNCLIAENTANVGGGVYEPEFIASSTLTDNSQEAIAATEYCIIANTIVAYNAAGILAATSSQPTMLHNCVFGNTAFNFDALTDPTGSNGNISEAPLIAGILSPGPDRLWGTADDDFSGLELTENSPCIDAGDATSLPPDLLMDVAGLPRITDGNCDETATVDMGAHEFQTECSGILAEYAIMATCLAGPGITPDPDEPTTATECVESFDLDTDGDVDLADFAAFQATFQ